MAHNPRFAPPGGLVKWAARQYCHYCRKKVGRIKTDNIRVEIVDDSRVATHLACYKIWLEKQKRQAMPMDTQQPPSRSESMSSLTEAPSTSRSEESEINLPIIKIPNRHDVCVFTAYGACQSSTRLHYIREEARLQALVQKKVYLPVRTCCCPQHVTENGLFTPEALNIFRPESGSFKAEEILDMMKRLVKGVTDRSETSGSQNYFFEELSDANLKELTGISRSQFKEMEDCLVELPINAPNSFPLGLYLNYLRTGLSMRKLSIYFKIPVMTLHRYITLVRQKLVSSFVPQHIGLTLLTREMISRNTTTQAKILYGIPLESPDPPIIVILDCTYGYTQKSDNFRFQRLSWSSYKHRNLAKPLFMVTTNGLVITTFDVPFEGKTNDATAMRRIIDREDFQRLFRPGDIFVLDRGFDDIREELESRGYIVKMPAFLGPKQAQFTAEDANATRLVTAVRGEIERINGRMKNMYKFLTHVIDIKAFKHYMDDVNIAISILNAFTPRHCPDEEESIEIAHRMLALLNGKNKVLDLVDGENLTRMKRTWVGMAGSLPSLAEFPRFDERQLRLLACGPYQIKMALAYWGEHSREDGLFWIEVGQDSINSQTLAKYQIDCQTPLMIRGRFQSRHSEKTKYYLFILLDRSQNCVDQFLGWWCQCKNGARMVGCCSHIMCVIWYLAFGRYQANLKAPSQFLDEFFTRPEADGALATEPEDLLEGTSSQQDEPDVLEDENLVIDNHNAEELVNDLLWDVPDDERGYVFD